VYDSEITNGQRILSDLEVKNLEWWIQRYTFQIHARVLDLTAYDLILGMDWLEQHNPMTCDWLMKWMEFEYQGTTVRLQGILPPNNSIVSKISGEQLHKLAKGNDMWALVMVMARLIDSSKQEQYFPPEVQHLILDNGDLFQTPTNLPPSRVFDHAIPLISGSVPVNSRPYRYTPQ
jgi:hypothetical protein